MVKIKVEGQAKDIRDDGRKLKRKQKKRGSDEMPNYNVEIEYDDEEFEIEAESEQDAQDEALTMCDPSASKITITEIEVDE